MTRVVNILGMGPCGASFHSKDTPGEVWGINYAYLNTDYLDRLFMFHRWDQFVKDASKPERRHKYFLKELQDNVGEVWTIDKLQVVIPNAELPIEADRQKQYSLAVEYRDCYKDQDQAFKEQYSLLVDSKTIDLGELILLFGSDYFTCTLPYLIGQAILEGVTHINLFGVEVWDYHCTGKYADQAKCINAWLHFARARGIQIMIPWISAMKHSDRIFIK